MLGAVLGGEEGRTGRPRPAPAQARVRNPPAYGLNLGKWLAAMTMVLRN
jgi:hypothetical protein